MHHNLERLVADRTEQLRKAKEESERANTAKSSFLAAASHDLRQPLQAANAYLAALEAKLNASDLSALADKLRHSIDVMGDVLNTLLDVSMLQTGAIMPEITEFPLGALLVSVVADFDAEANEKGLTINTMLAPGFVRSDPALLRRVVANLLCNAIRYTPEGSISIRCWPQGENMCVEVKDSGVGIPPDAIDHIFDEYYQVGNPERDRRHGLGMGLAIVRQISGLLGFTIVVRSALGKGSTFRFRIPMAATARLQPPSERSDANRAIPPDTLVLFVDDEPANVDSMRLMLNLHDVPNQHAKNATEALAMVKGGLQPSVILTDFRLPDITGLELISCVRQLTSRALPAIILTGDTTSINQDAANIAGCVLLRKPTESRQLIALIREMAQSGNSSSA